MDDLASWCAPPWCVSLADETGRGAPRRRARAGHGRGGLGARTRDRADDARRVQRPTRALTPGTPGRGRTNWRTSEARLLQAGMSEAAPGPLGVVLPAADDPRRQRRETGAPDTHTTPRTRPALCHTPGPGKFDSLRWCEHGQFEALGSMSSRVGCAPITSRTGRVRGSAGARDRGRWSTIGTASAAISGHRDPRAP